MTGFWNFGRVKQILEEATGLSISHVHDDLVFVDNSPFMVVFDPADLTHFNVWFNPEINPDDKLVLLAKLQETSPRHGMHCSHAGTVTLEPVPGKEEVSLRFEPLSA